MLPEGSVRWRCDRLLGFWTVGFLLLVVRCWMEWAWPRTFRDQTQNPSSAQFLHFSPPRPSWLADQALPERCEKLAGSLQVNTFYLATKWYSPEATE